MMKRLMLLVTLSLAAVAVAPIASASAAEGSCEIKGNAEFSPEIELAPKAGVEYSFKSTGGKCVTTPATEFVEATVRGKGDIGCLASTEEGAGTGTLTYKEAGKEVKKEFKFFFEAAGALVAFHTEGEVTSVGAATFGKEGLEACEKGKVKGLPFTAVATGKV